MDCNGNCTVYGCNWKKILEEKYGDKKVKKITQENA